MAQELIKKYQLINMHANIVLIPIQVPVYVAPPHNNPTVSSWMLSFRLGRVTRLFPPIEEHPDSLLVNVV